MPSSTYGADLYDSVQPVRPQRRSKISGKLLTETQLQYETSFSAKINELSEQNAMLSRDLQEWKDKAAAESERRRCVEDENQQLQTVNQQL